jgi:hypothetical protein
MFIKIYPDKHIDHPQIEEHPFNIEVDPQSSMETIKVLISLKFVDLDPESFELTEMNST